MLIMFKEKLKLKEKRALIIVKNIVIKRKDINQSVLES
jgi:hypothetical protein